MNKKLIIFIPIILAIVILSGIYIAYNNIATAHYNAAFNFLNSYYSKDNYNILEKLADEMSSEGITDTFEALFQEKYNDLLTKEAYEHLAANRIILEPEQIVKDFDCSLELISVDIQKESKTVEGNHVYSYNARINVTLPNKEYKNFIETGTIEFFKEDNQWKVNRLNINKGNLYNSIEKFISIP